MINVSKSIKFNWSKMLFFPLLKFSFSEKDTKICAIFFMVWTFRYLVNVQTMKEIVLIFVAFSKKLNFTHDAMA